MSGFPSRSSLFPVGALLPSSFKVLLGQFYDAVTGLLGTSGNASDARELLNVALTNYLDNPDGAVYQRAIAATADDAYADDRWYALTQTGSITPSQVSNPEDGFRYALRLTQSQAAAQRMGRAQIVPGWRTSELRGKQVTIGGRIKSSTAATIRVALLAWTGAEDVVTSDVVNNWASTTFTTGNFFASSSLSLIGTGSVAVTGGTPATISASGSVPSGATNLITFYWTDAAFGQNDWLDAWAMRLVQASTLVDYVRRTDGDELTRCKRYQQTTPVAAAGGTATSTLADIVFPLEVEMRAGPSVTVLNASPAFRIGGSTVTIPGTWSTLNVTRRAAYMQFARTSGTWAIGVPAFANDATPALLLDANL